VQREVCVIDLVLEVTGAILILVAFALAQFRGLDRHGSVYLVLNLVGAALLAASAATHRQWGFLLLQGVWAIVAVWGLLGLVRQVGSPS
jgi:membrane-bound ClpP family serine protease